MSLISAGTADIVRAYYRDEQFIDYFEEIFARSLKALVGRSYRRYSQYTAIATRIIYYTFTTLSNLQTLGEEYAGLLRINRKKNDIPGKLVHFLWLALHLGGEKGCRKVIASLEKRAEENEELRPEAREKLLSVLKYFSDNLHLIFKLHHALFYKFGDYYNISNRFCNIQYVLVRSYFKDTSSTEALKLLGNVSLLYLVFYVFYNLSKKTKEIPETHQQQSLESAPRGCYLCMENRTFTSVTLCGHLFCWDCIQKAILYQKACPLCREPLTSSSVILLQNF